MSTYVNNLRLEEIGSGERAGTWGDATNTNLELIGEAFGYGTEALSNASTATITMADASSDGVRSFYLKLTGALGQNCTVTLAPDTVSKIWIIENATTDSGSSGPYSTITSAGGGYGGSGDYTKPGGNGGSGGGGGRAGSAGSGNTPPVNPSQGNNGGAGSGGPSGSYGGGGGGGLDGPGGNGSGNNGGNGADGSALTITGSSVTYAE